MKDTTTFTGSGDKSYKDFQVDYAFDNCNHINVTSGNCYVDIIFVYVVGFSTTKVKYIICVLYMEQSNLNLNTLTLKKAISVYNAKFNDRQHFHLYSMCIMCLLHSHTATKNSFV